MADIGVPDNGEVDVVVCLVEHLVDPLMGLGRDLDNREGVGVDDLVEELSRSDPLFDFFVNVLDEVQRKYRSRRASPAARFGLPRITPFSSSSSGTVNMWVISR